MLARLAAALPSHLQLRLAATTATTASSHAGFASQASSSSSSASTIMIWGASGGIGSALSRRLLRSNSADSSSSRIVLVAEHEDKLQALQQELGGGNSVDVIAADARDPDAVEAAMAQAVKAHGRLVGAVNCVGGVEAASALATDLHHFRQALEVNLITSFNILKASVRAMLSAEGAAKHNQQPGSGSGGRAIVLTSAALASHGLPNYEAMSAAKAGVEGLARSAAATYAPHCICINCVAPGLTATPPTVKFTGDQPVAEASRQMHPLKQLASAEDVAAALEFLLRPGSVITGQVLAVDGGLSTLHPHHASDYAGV